MWAVKPHAVCKTTETAFGVLLEARQLQGSSHTSRLGMTAETARREAFEKKLAELESQIKDEEKRKAFRAEMDGFRGLVNRFLDKSQNKPIEWEKIKPPPPGVSTCEYCGSLAKCNVSANLWVSIFIPLDGCSSGLA